MRTDLYSNVNGIAYIKAIKHMYLSTVNANGRILQKLTEIQ